MTRKEIIKELEKTVAGAEILTSLGYEEVNEYLDIFKVALSALRPVSREQVEEVWRGEWEGVPRLGVYDMACSKCGFCPGIRFYSSDFCPSCGAPMTDKAVDMVMERLEEVQNDQ